MTSRALRSICSSAAVAAAVLLLGSAAGARQSPVSKPPVRETIPGTTVAFEMVAVPGGTVTLDGKPVKVEPFEIGRTEVTWDMYDVFALGLDVKDAAADATTRPSQPYANPDYGWGHAGYAAISIARPAAEAFCVWLSARTGKTYRLPTEAEWVHAARLASGGSAVPPERMGALAWHAGNAAEKAHPVAQKQADALGLYDLFGNVAEWVATADGSPVARGGSFRDPIDRVGPSARALQDDTWNERDPQLPKSRWWLSDGPFVGFRVARKP